MKAAFRSFDVQKWEYKNHNFENLNGFRVFVKDNCQPSLYALDFDEDFFKLELVWSFDFINYEQTQTLLAYSVKTDYYLSIETKLKRILQE